MKRWVNCQHIENSQVPPVRKRVMSSIKAVSEAVLTVPEQSDVTAANFVESFCLNEVEGTAEAATLRL